MKQTKCDNCGISDDLTKDTYRGRRWHKSVVYCITALRARVEVLESELKAANEDAGRLAAELSHEQNPGFMCAAIAFHLERIARKYTAPPDETLGSPR